MARQSGTVCSQGLDRPVSRMRRRPSGARHRQRLLVDCLEERTLLSSYSSFFQLDGDTSSSYPAAATGHDWSQVFSDFKKTTTNASGTGAINFYNDPVPVTVPGVPAQTEDAFSGGNSKDTNDINQWTYDNSTPQNKANLENASAASYIDPANNNHTYLYVGADRYDNSGSTIIGVWFLQNPVAQSNGQFYVANPDGSPSGTLETHKNGDVLLVANFGGGGAVSITSFTWNNGLPTTGTTLDSTKGLAVVNSTALDGASGHAPAVPWPYRSSASGTAANFVQSGEFFEAGVDLNNLFGSSGPFNFSSFIVETRASTSAKSTLSDFIVGHVSTAPDVAVTKVADGSPLALGTGTSANASVDAGSQVGYTVTVKNVGVGDALNVTLTDNSTAGLPTTSTFLPSGVHNDIVWSIPTGGNPSGDIVLTGTTAGTQHLSLISGLTLAFNSTAISVHLVGTGSTQGDGVLDNRATVGASNEADSFLSNNQADAQITIVDAGVSTVTPQSSVEGASQTFQMGTFTSANSGTASVDVDWGDGSTHTTFTFVNTANVALAMPSKTHTYGEEGPYTVTETVTLGSIKSGTFSVTVSDPAVIAAPVSTITKTYDGLIVGIKNLATFTDPGGAEPNSSDSGPLENHYTASVDWGGSFGTSSATISFDAATSTFTVSASIPYANVNATSYSPTITINHENSTAQVVTDTVTISPALLTITADAAPATAANDDFTKVYDGHVYTSFTARYDGFVNGETAAVLGGTLGFSGAGTTAVNVGNGYVVTPGGQTSTNYDIHYVNGSLNITRAPLTVTAENDSFDEGIAPSGLTATISGFVNGETLATSGVTGNPTLTTNATGTSAPGNMYTITPTQGTLTAGNYEFTIFNPGTLTVVDVAPTILMSGGTITLSPGDGFTRPGAFNDPGSVVPSETWTMTISYGDGSPDSGSTTPGPISISHVYANAGTYAVTVTIGDNYGTSSVLTFTVIVAQSPTLTLSHGGSPIGPTASASKGVAFDITGLFTESTGTGSWVINWGDPAGDSGGNLNVQSGNVTGGSGNFTGSHKFKHIGTYMVSVTFTDASGANVTQSFALTVS
jgi:uncharacterized repeat protein (TIGR01451 family)